MMMMMMMMVMMVVVTMMVRWELFTVTFQLAVLQPKKNEKTENEKKPQDK